MTRVSPDSQLEKGQHRHWHVSRAGDQQHDQENSGCIYIEQLETSICYISDSNNTNLPTLGSKEYKIQTCRDFLSINSDDEQSYQSVPSICMNSFTSMGAAPLLPADKRQHINTDTKFWYEKQWRKLQRLMALQCKPKYVCQLVKWALSCNTVLPSSVLPVEYKYCHLVALKGTHISLEAQPIVPTSANLTYI